MAADRAQGGSLMGLIGVAIAMVIATGIVLPMMSDLMAMTVFATGQERGVRTVTDLVPLMIVITMVVIMMQSIMRIKLGPSGGRSRSRSSGSDGPPLRVALAGALGLTRELTTEDRLERIHEAYATGEISELEMEDRIADLFDIEEERELDEIDEALGRSMRDHV